LRTGAHKRSYKTSDSSGESKYSISAILLFTPYECERANILTLIVPLLKKYIMPIVWPVFSNEERAPSLEVRLSAGGEIPKQWVGPLSHVAHRLGTNQYMTSNQHTDFPRRPQAVLHVGVRGGSQPKGGGLQTGSDKCRDRNRCSRPAQ